MTCHNRREQTLNCIKSLFEATLPKDTWLKVYLVDDGSTDGTTEAIKENFPKIKIIPGNGNLYWNKGMRLAWETAAEDDNFDFFLWLNDDTILDKNFLGELLGDFQEALDQEKSESIIIGSCRNEIEHETFSYGGRDETGPIIPNGKIQKCKFINGNLVLIHHKIFDSIGNLSPLYTHAIGDNDYGLRAINAGYNCFVSKNFIATCPQNELAPWCNPRYSLVKRFKNLYSPKGLNIKEYIVFLKNHHKKNWLISTIKVYLKTLSPKTYQLFAEKLT